MIRIAKYGESENRINKRPVKGASREQNVHDRMEKEEKKKLKVWQSLANLQ
jgi:hypothetical protein